MKTKTLEELYIAVKSNEINEANLKIVLDDDGICFCLDSKVCGSVETETTFIIGGDVHGLYEFLFPEACVEWC